MITRPLLLILLAIAGIASGQAATVSAPPAPASRTTSPPAVANPSPYQAPPMIVSGATLSFGSFAALGGGTLTLAPSGLRTWMGVAPIGNGAISAASFSVISNSSHAYTLSLPSVAYLNGVKGGSMKLSNFSASSPGGICSNISCHLQPGSQTLYLGATLNVSPQQPVGSYTGNYSLTICYE